MKDEGSAVEKESDSRKLRFHPSSFSLHPYAFSNPAYFSTSFFWPKPGKLTRSLAASPTPSRRSTRPRPYFGCLTCVPGVKPAAAEEEEDEEDADGRPPPAAGRGCVGGAGGACRLVSAEALRRIWSPRWRKNSAMESALS